MYGFSLMLIKACWEGCLDLEALRGRRGLQSETLRVGCVVCVCVAGHTGDRTGSRRRFCSNLRHAGSSVNLGWCEEHFCKKKATHGALVHTQELWLPEEFGHSV